MPNIPGHMQHRLQTPMMERTHESLGSRTPPTRRVHPSSSPQIHGGTELDLSVNTDIRIFTVGLPVPSARLGVRVTRLCSNRRLWHRFEVYERTTCLGYTVYPSCSRVLGMPWLELGLGFRLGTGIWTGLLEKCVNHGFEATNWSKRTFHKHIRCP